MGRVFVVGMQWICVIQKVLEALGSLWNGTFAKGESPAQHLCGVYKRDLHAFQGGKRLHGRSGAIQGDIKGGEWGAAITGEPALVTLLCGMLYDDDAGTA